MPLACEGVESVVRARVQLALESVTKAFGKVVALSEVTFTVEKGQVVCIIGPSGSGKTTLLRCVALLERIDSGRIVIDGIPFTKGGPSHRSSDGIRGRIGFVFQNYSLWPHRTALENILEGLVVVKHLSRREAIEIADPIIRRVRIQHTLGKHPKELSGGEIQRVAIARALAMEPEILLLDEITSALDPEHVAEILSLLEDLSADNRTTLVVTHEMNFAKHVADSLVFLEGGRIVEQGNPDKLLTEPSTDRLRTFLDKVLMY